MSLTRSVLGASRERMAPAASKRMFKRDYSQDLLIKHRTGMPQVAHGPYGLGRYA